jgi:wyosine [tRNA(Phe)-imidazoG37] synthetase (radical SAM superfamily)
VEMPDGRFKYVYGPVPSRRLGRSLGVDLVPLKTCTYDCVYCQLGRTTDKTVERTSYGDADEIIDEVKRRLGSDPATPGYVGLAGSGEPTLNADIGKIIEGIKRVTSVPIAVLTNGSLLWMAEVQDALMAADVVLPSLDAGDAGSFEYVNRPHPLLGFEEVVEGIASFTKRYQGEVWLEVLLLGGVTGIPSRAQEIAALARRIGPARVQLNTVCRPPAEQFALSLSQDEMLALSALFSGEVDIISRADRPPVAAQDAAETRGVDVLALLRRRPCTLQDVADGLGAHVNEVLKELDTLVGAGAVTTTVVGGRVFYSVEGSMDGLREPA